MIENFKKKKIIRILEELMVIIFLISNLIRFNSVNSKLNGVGVGVGLSNKPKSNLVLLGLVWFAD
jgi:hypothetical protein